jgi:uncharacterized Fe-S center protein
MAEHALGVLKGKENRAVFINFAVKITKNCDCIAKDEPRICDDIGFLLSTDPIAIEKATLDLVTDTMGNDIFKKSYPHLDPMVQIRHGEKIGLGTTNYELIEIEYNEES